MKKEICWAIVWIVAVTLTIASLADAADFSVDKRSPLHFVGSGMISATVNTMAVEYDIPEVTRNRWAFATAFGAGLVKEFVMDSDPDYGDILFNGLGAWGGIYVSEKYFILPSEKGVTVGGKF